MSDQPARVNVFRVPLLAVASELDYAARVTEDATSEVFGKAGAVLRSLVAEADIKLEDDDEAVAAYFEPMVAQLRRKGSEHHD